MNSLQVLKNNRIMIAGTNSGCGKTTVTCAVLQALVNRGISVSSFKCGPDYIDPIFHSRIIGTNSRNLDSWFCNKDTLNFILDKSTDEISVIEGVMGFYDGVGDSFSSCQTAIDTNTSVVIVIDCRGMSSSVGAVMKGFLTFKKPNNIIGFIFNRLPESLVDTAKNFCKEMNVEYLGRLPNSKNLNIESRHLGLVTDIETAELKHKMQQLAMLAEDNILIDKLIEFSKITEPVSYEIPNIKKITHRPVRIALSSDAAFCFCYRDNVELLMNLGCEIAEFSPIHDEKLPENIDGLIIVGGYPELYAKKLSKNKSMLNDIKNKVNSGVPTIAECGGFMYLHEELESDCDENFQMVGAIRGKCFKTNKLQRFGYVNITAESDNLLCGKGEILKAHEFHYWDSTNGGNNFIAEKASNGVTYKCVHSTPNLYAGYPHLYFYANPECAVNFVKKCEEYGEKWKD